MDFIMISNCLLVYHLLLMNGLKWVLVLVKLYMIIWNVYCLLKEYGKIEKKLKIKQVKLKNQNQRLNQVALLL